MPETPNVTQWGGNSPILWLNLMNDMDAFKAVTGWGLALTWGLVRAGRYDEARADFERTKARYIKEKADNRA
jgi:hypothetical protein